MGPIDETDYRWADYINNKYSKICEPKNVYEVSFRNNETYY